MQIDFILRLARMLIKWTKSCCANTNSKVSIIRPGHSRLLEFEKKKDSTGLLIENFSKYPNQVV